MLSNLILKSLCPRVFFNLSVIVLTFTLYVVKIHSDLLTNCFLTPSFLVFLYVDFSFFFLWQTLFRFICALISDANFTFLSLQTFWWVFSSRQFTSISMFFFRFKMLFFLLSLYGSSSNYFLAHLMFSQTSFRYKISFNYIALFIIYLIIFLYTSLRYFSLY